MGDSKNVTVMVTDKEKALVGKIAEKVFKRYCPAGRDGQIEREELFHLGIVGLLEAKQRFDPELGVPFLAYASTRIRGAMLDQIRVQPVVRTSQEFAKKAKQLKKARERFLREGRNPGDRRLAEELGWSVGEVQKVSAQSVHMVPVRENVERDDDKTPYRGVIAVEQGPDAEEALLKRELAETMQACLENLPSDELRMILVGRVLENVKLREFAETMDCSMQTVSNRERQARDLMRACLEKHDWTLEELSKIMR